MTVDIVEDFKPFLKEWCHKKHLPIPEEGKTTKVWQKAWQEYMDTYLTEHYEEIRQDYLNMPVLTREELRKQLAEESIKKESKEESSWDRIKEQLD